MTSVIPTFHKGAKTVLDTLSDVAAYLVRMLYINPGAVTSAYYHSELSLRSLIAHYGDDPDTLGRMVQQRLQNALNDFIDKGPAEVTCDVRQDGEVNYRLNISITDGNGDPVIEMTSFAIEGSKIIIDSTE